MIVLIALFSLAIGVWTIPLIRVSRTSQLAAAVLVAGTIAGPAFFAIEALVQISIDRVIWIGLLVVAAIRWRMGQLQLSRLNRVDWILLVLAGWLLVGALRGGPVPTGSSPLARWLFYIAMPAGMYFVCRCVQPTSSELRWLGTAMLALGTYLSVTAILEVSGWHGLVFPRFIVDPQAWEFFGRGRGPLLNPAGNGILMAIALVVAMIKISAADRRGMIVLSVATIVICAGLYATLTRSVWLGAGGAVAVIAMVYAPRWLRVLGLVAVIALCGGLALGLKDQLLRLERDKHLTAADAEKSIELRPLLAVVAWEMFKDRPVIGHGFGHYFEHSPAYHKIGGYQLPLEQAREYAQHCVLLSILVDAGLVGIVLLLALFLILAAIGWQLARDRLADPASRGAGLLLLSTLVIYLCNGLFHDVSVIPMVHMFLFSIAGLAMGIKQRGLASERQMSCHASMLPAH